MIKNVLVLGAGSAGLLASIAVKRKLPQLAVRVVRSPDIGVIGVGEGTTPNFPAHLFDFLGISRRRFYELAQPTWKLGIRFIWGPRGRFDYGFAHQLDQDTGAANGAPYVGRGALQQAWARVMNQEFAALREGLARAQPSLIGPYAATSPAEFFAVTTELFFEKPAALAAERPELYEQLKRCYRLDPASW